jgi:membrane-associated protease RseP (regulator of RpoE activity)
MSAMQPPVEECESMNRTISMRNRITHLFAIVGLCVSSAAATAAPDRSDTNSDDVHVTVSAGRGRLGVSVIEISPELRSHFGAPKDRGVLVDSVRADQPAARAGVRVGDLVTEVDGAPVDSASDILEAMSDRKKGERITIDVMRAGTHYRFATTLDTDPGPRMRRMGEMMKGMPKDFDWQFALPQMHDDAIKRQLDETRQRIDALEQRLDKLDRT